MSSSDYTVNEILNTAINAYLTNSKHSFATIKSHVIAGEPIGEVMLLINTRLSQEELAQKKEFLDSSLTEFYQQQIADDRSEAESDIHQAQRDKTTAGTIPELIRQLESTISQNTQSIEQLGRETRALTNEKNRLDNRLLPINASISTLKSEKHLINSQLLFTSQNIYENQIAFDSGFHHHRHHHHNHNHISPVHTHLILVQNPEYTRLKNQLRDVNCQLDSRESEKRPLSLQLSTVNSNISANDSQINSYSRESKSSRNQIASLERELTHLLPEQEADRKARKKTRNLRKLTQKNYEQSTNSEQIKESLIRQCLSDEMNHKLTQSITSNDRALAQRRHSLEQQAEQQVNTSFKSYLIPHLKELQLLDNEKQAIKQVCELMSEYFTQVQHAENCQQQLDVLGHQLYKQQLLLSQNQQRLDTLQQQNPKKDSENQRLQSENKILYQKIYDKKFSRNSLGIASLTSLGLSAASIVPIVLLTTAVISLASFALPLFIAATATLAAITLSLAIASLVQHMRAKGQQVTLNRNHLTIENNEKSISTVSKEITQLQIKTLPENDTQIRQLSEKINNKHAEKEWHAQQAGSYYHQAKQVNPTSQFNQPSSFFANQGGYSHSALNPANETFPPEASAPSPPMFNPEYNAFQQ